MQERAVGDLLAVGYEAHTGKPLANCRQPGSDPPDLLFDCNGQTIGAELMQLEAFNEERALLDAFCTLVYAEFDRHVQDDRYLGVVIQLTPSIGIDWLKTVEQNWTHRDVTKSPLRQAARELYALVTSSVSSRDAIENSDPGLLLRIQSRDYPALSALSSWVALSQCRVATKQRSDGRAAPLVVGGGVYVYEPGDLEIMAIRCLQKKVARTAEHAWDGTNRSLLVVHDLPREEMYEAFGRDWDRVLPAAAAITSVLDHYDELWLVRGGGGEQPAQPIHPGIHPTHHRALLERLAGDGSK